MELTGLVAASTTGCGTDPTAEVITYIKGIRDNPPNQAVKGNPVHIRKWNRALSTIGEETGQTPWTETEIRGWATQWPESPWTRVVEVLDYNECIRTTPPPPSSQTQDPPPDPPPDLVVQSQQSGTIQTCLTHNGSVVQPEKVRLYEQDGDWIIEIPENRAISGNVCTFTNTGTVWAPNDGKYYDPFVFADGFVPTFPNGGRLLIDTEFNGKVHVWMGNDNTFRVIDDDIYTGDKLSEPVTLGNAPMQFRLLIKDDEPDFPECPAFPWIIEESGELNRTCYLLDPISAGSGMGNAELPGSQVVQWGYGSDGGGTGRLFVGIASTDDNLVTGDRSFRFKPTADAAEITWLRILEDDMSTLVVEEHRAMAGRRARAEIAWDAVHPLMSSVRLGGVAVVIETDHDFGKPVEIYGIGSGGVIAQELASKVAIYLPLGNSITRTDDSRIHRAISWTAADIKRLMETPPYDDHHTGPPTAEILSKFTISTHGSYADVGSWGRDANHCTTGSPVVCSAPGYGLFRPQTNIKLATMDRAVEPTPRRLVLRSGRTVEGGLPVFIRIDPAHNNSAGPTLQQSGTTKSVWNPTLRGGEVLTYELVRRSGSGPYECSGPDDRILVSTNNYQALEGHVEITGGWAHSIDRQKHTVFLPTQPGGERIQWDSARLCR